MFFCWICKPDDVFADITDDAVAPTPFFGATTKRPALDAQSRLRAEMAAELLLMAVGRHTYFLEGLLRPHQLRDDDADDEATDQRQHTQAAVALRLLQQLRFMEAMDEKLTAAARETAASVIEYRTAMQVFFETLQRKIEQDGATLAAFMDAETDLRGWYRGLPATRRRYAAVRVVSASALLRIVGRESAFVRRLAVCTLFLEAARATDERRYSKLAQNVLRLARNSDAAPHIERIFQAAVDQTVADAENSLQDGQRTLEALLHTLVHKMRADAQLNSQSTRAKLWAP